jgi:hypothetical protein
MSTVRLVNLKKPNVNRAGRNRRIPRQRSSHLALPRPANLTMVCPDEAPLRGRKGDWKRPTQMGAATSVVPARALPFRVILERLNMRILIVLFSTLPSVALAHAGHPAGTGHDLWIIGAAFAVAAIFGLIRKV